MKKKSSQTLNDKELKENTPLTGLAGLIPKTKKILKPKDVQRLMSKLISGFCNGSIKSDEAKCLTYLCSQYIAITQAVNFESRLTELERKAGME
jgi:hypothetical protein